MTQATNLYPVPLTRCELRNRYYTPLQHLSSHFENFLGNLFVGTLQRKRTGVRRVLPSFGNGSSNPVCAACRQVLDYGATITGVKHLLPYLYSFLAGFGTAMTVYFFRNK